MNYIFPIIYLVLFNFTICIVTRKKFGTCLPITFILSTLILFISQIVFKTFSIGLIINIIISLLSIILLLRKVLKKENLNELKYNFFSKGFYVFGVLCILFLVLDHGRPFSQWDELSHWGVMVREMLRLDKFYSVDASTLLVHKDYPPFVSIFEMLWCKLSGGYNEGSLTMAIHIFEFSLFIPAIDEMHKVKNKLSFILKSFLAILVIMIIIAVLDTGYIMNTIYIDIFMMILFASSIYQIYTFDNITKFDIFKLVLSLVALVLTKQMGLPLFLLTVFYLIIKIFLKYIYKKKIDKRTLINFMIIILVVMIIPFIFYKIWGIYISLLNINGQFQLSDIKLSSLLGMLSKTSGTASQQAVIPNYISALLHKPLISYPLKFTFFSLIIFVVLLFIGLNKYIKNKETTKKLSVLGLVLMIGTAGYTFAMLLLYIFSFSSEESLILASFERYMSTFIIALVSVITMIFINFESKQKDEKKKINSNHLVVFILIGLMLVNTPVISELIPSIVKPRNDFYDSYNNYANKLMRKVEKDAKVFLITPTSCDYHYFIKYYAGDISININYTQLPPKEEIDNKKEEIYNELSKYDYVYLVNINDDYIESYKFLFNSEDTLNDGDIFKVINNENEISLKKVV